MPFEKVVITHKFGIISQTHKKQLQERLLERREQLYNQAKKRDKKDENIINIQITEEFVKEYNEASYEKKTRLDYMCLQMFEKIKKRLITFTSTDDLNIQLAWAELSQLMQCNSPIQEECLDLFILSMQFAHLSVLQIPTLFFLAETVIYWIRTDTINQPFLRAFEIKLLKVGQLIFQRIYFYLNEEDNQNQNDLKEHLAIYLQGFDDYENAYSPYPDALLYMRYIINVGKYITRNIKLKSDENDEINKETMNEGEKDEEKANQEERQKFEEMKSGSQTPTMSSEEAKESNRLFNDNTSGSNSGDSFNISPMVTQASIILALLNKKYIEKMLDLSLENLIECSTSLTKESWIDNVFALNVIGECAKLNLKALNCLLLISKLSSTSVNYDLSRSISNSSKNTETLKNQSDQTSNSSFHMSSRTQVKRGIESWPWELACVYAEILSEVCINGSLSQIKKKALLGFNGDSKEAFNVRHTDLKGYGLLDLTRLMPKNRVKNREDHSWKVRYSAIKALVSICKALNDKINEELRQTCWTSLIICKENETNYNVLEAIKVGQIATNTEEFATCMNKSKKSTSNFSKPNHGNINIHFLMAKKITDTLTEYEEQRKTESMSSEKQLRQPQVVKIVTEKTTKNPTDSSTENDDYDLKSSRFENLPIGKLTNINKWSANSREVSSRDPSKMDKIYKNTKSTKKRTTLKDEIILSDQFQNKIPDFATRKNVDLMRIVEDQYRKEEKKKFEETLIQQS